MLGVTPCLAIQPFQQHVASLQPRIIGFDTAFWKGPALRSGTRYGVKAFFRYNMLYLISDSECRQAFDRQKCGLLPSIYIVISECYRIDTRYVVAVFSRYNMLYLNLKVSIPAQPVPPLMCVCWANTIYYRQDCNCATFWWCGFPTI